MLVELKNEIILLSQFDVALELSLFLLHTPVHLRSSSFPSSSLAIQM